MGQIRKLSPKAHPFVAIMFPNDELYDKALIEIQNWFGEIIGKGPIFRVLDFTKYYEREFGSELKKQFIVFKEPYDLEKLYLSKVWSNELELKLGNHAKNIRYLNIDPGYLAPSRFVLYSSKDFSHRIYQGNGIFAEITMLFIHGDFKKMDWTYPDYMSTENLNFIKKMRNEIVSLSRSNKG